MNIQSGENEIDAVVVIKWKEGVQTEIPESKQQQS